MRISLADNTSYEGYDIFLPLEKRVLPVSLLKLLYVDDSGCREGKNNKNEEGLKDKGLS